MTDLRTLERESIRSFVASCAPHFTGRVLDYGCGAMPYADIVKAAGGEYVGYDRADLPGNVGGDGMIKRDPLFWVVPEWNAILITQVLQYCSSPTWVLGCCRRVLHEGGALVISYGLTWPEVEEADLWRFTRAGMTRMLVNAGFVIERHERRAEIVWQGETFATGYGVVARA